jgi:hypothetical protein
MGARVENVGAAEEFTGLAVKREEIAKPQNSLGERNLETTEGEGGSERKVQVQTGPLNLLRVTPKSGNQRETQLLLFLSSICQGWVRL